MEDKVYTIPYSPNKQGAFEDRPDSRDYQYGSLEVAGTPLGSQDLQIDWQKGYNVEEELKKQFGVELKIENQGSSLSCVGQAFSKYAEVLNIVETKGETDLSAKSIYEQIFLPNGGAYLRDGARAVVRSGVATEEQLPSYEVIKGSQGQVLAVNPPSEDYMRKQTIDDEMRKAMLTYQAKEYRTVGGVGPLADLLAHAILNNWGAIGGARGDNEGWRNYPVLPPDDYGDWGHAYYYTGFGMDTKGKYFDFINSWGELWGLNGRGRMYFEEYNMPKNTFSNWTLIDKPNLIKEDMQIVKTEAEPHLYLISADGKKRIMLVDYPTLEALKQPHKVISQDEMSKYEDGGTLVWTDRIIN